MTARTTHSERRDNRSRKRRWDRGEDKEDTTLVGKEAMSCEQILARVIWVTSSRVKSCSWS